MKTLLFPPIFRFRCRFLLLSAMAGLLAGCGGETSKPADPKKNWENREDIQRALKLILPEEPYADFAALQKKADAGDIDSAALVALEYRRGDLVQRDEAKMHFYLDKALAGKSAVGYYLNCFLVDERWKNQGIGSEAECQAAWDHAFDALQQVKEPDGTVLDALCLIHGNGKGSLIEKDWNKGWEYCVRACEFPVPQPWVRRAWFYEQGLGPVERNMGEAMKCYAKAARMGSSLANHHLARCYLTGVAGEVNEEMALGYLVRAVQKGVPEAQQDLDRILEGGISALTKALSRNLVSDTSKVSFRFQNGERVWVAIPDQQGEGWGGIVVDQRQGKYKVQVQFVKTGSRNFLGELGPCPCTGQETIREDLSGPKTVWVPEECAESAVK